MTHEKSLGLESESMESHLLTKYVIERKGDQHPNTSIPPFQTQDYESLMRLHGSPLRTTGGKGHQKMPPRGTCVAQSVKPPTSAQGMISRFVGSSPTSGSVLTGSEPGAHFGFCVSPSLSLPRSHSVSVSQINIKKIKRKKKKSRHQEERGLRRGDLTVPSQPKCPSRVTCVWEPICGVFLSLTLRVWERSALENHHGLCKGLNC